MATSKWWRSFLGVGFEPESNFFKSSIGSRISVRETAFCGLTLLILVLFYVILEPSPEKHHARKPFTLIYAHFNVFVISILGVLLRARLRTRCDLKLHVSDIF